MHVMSTSIRFACVSLSLIVVTAVYMQIADAQSDQSRADRRAEAALKRYVISLERHIRANWIRSLGFQPGRQCTAEIFQDTDGMVLSVELVECGVYEGDKQSVINAISESSPLPLPSDMEIFQRRIHVRFAPDAPLLWSDLDLESSTLFSQAEAALQSIRD